MYRYIWLVPLLPLIGTAINGIFGRWFRFSEKLIGGIAVGSVALLAESLGILAAILVAGSGVWLYRRFGAAINYTGIGRPYPIGNSVLAFLGIALLFVGLSVAGGIVMVLLYR